MSEERDYVRRERHKDKGHPATIKLLLLRSFTVSLSKEARALHLTGEYCFRKKASPQSIGEKKVFDYSRPEKTRIQVFRKGSCMSHDCASVTGRFNGDKSKSRHYY